ncbi:MAG: sulfite reductase flavoprotein subunit alpha [Gammaproteobacteria bacterium]
MSSPASSPDPHPLDRDQLGRLTEVVQTFGRDQLLWASGYLAGLAAPRESNVVPVLRATPSAEGPRAARALTIFFATQTGNSRRVAELAAKRAAELQLPARLVDLADYSPRSLKQETVALFVVSTQGDGDPPEDAVGFFEFLQNANAPRLDTLRYGVIALGDSSYPHFCRAGSVLDARLAELGAARLQPRVDCDLQFEAEADGWIARALPEVAERLRAVPPRISVVESVPRTSASGAAPRAETRVALLLNQRLTGRFSTKDVRHLEFALSDPAFRYAPGDGIAILPRNPAPVCERVLTALGASGSEIVQGPRGTPRALASVLTEEVELTLLSRPFLATLHARAPHPDLAQMLSPAGADAFAAFLAEHQVADALRRFAPGFSPAELIDVLRPLARRTYSVASAPAATPDEVHLLVAVVRAESAHGARLGAASNYLAAQAAGDEITLQLEPNPGFHLPVDETTPLIMIGPGTGVAPFRAFIAERAARGVHARHWLFFGERTQREDFLYQLEWQKALAQGTLTRLDVAFSRDEANKVYVQHRLLAHARDLYAWLEDGAALYVCGDARHMARDVHAALIDAVGRGGGLSEDRAREYIQALQKSGRYRRDVY